MIFNEIISDLLVPALEGTIQSRISLLLKKYGDGLSAADIQTFAVEIAADTATALAMGRVDLLEEIEAQIAARMERHRIRLVAEQNEFVIQTIHELMRFGLQLGAMVAQNAFQSLVMKIGDR